jgi:hypothetical protein
LHTLHFRVGATARRAFLDATMFQLRGNTEDRENDLREIGRGIEAGLSQ